MEETKHTHITLATTFWGVTSVGGTAGTQVAKWLRMEQMPSRIVAEHVAQYFKASLEEMLSDSGEYTDPSHLIVSKSGKQLGTKPARRAIAAPRAVQSVVAAPTKKKKKANGHEVQAIDPRWTLPMGVPTPRILLELAPDSPGGLTKIQVEAHVPPEVAMAIYTTLVEHRQTFPPEVAATVYTPLVGHKETLPSG